MDNRRLPLALAALMLVCTPFVVASGSNDGICDGEVGGSPGGGPDGEGAGIQCDIITGPSTLTIKSVLTVGIGFCQTETTDIPLQCEGDAGDINGAGAASFGDATWTGQRQINVDVTLNTSTCTAATSPPCGFTVEICNDRDHDSTCTNIIAQNDELFDTATSEGIVFEDCKDQKKDCADPNEASWEGCMNPSIFDDWEDDQIIIFIGAEVGPTVDLADFGGINPDNVTETILNITDFVQNSSADAQAAVAVGTFTIFVEDVGTPTGCLTPLATCSIAAGHDLFETDAAGTYVGPEFSPVLHFQGVPVGFYDFGSITATVGADTIVKRSSASSSSPVATIELVKLQLQGVEDATVFVTLQSDRGGNALDPPDGPPSLGVLNIQFNEDCSGGTFDSVINVNFDVRQNAINGLIIASGSLTLVTNGMAWDPTGDPGSPGCMDHPEAGDPIGVIVLAVHRICGPSEHVDGVNDEFFPREPSGSEPQNEPLACEGDWTVGALDGSADNPFNGASCDSGTCSDDYDGTGYPTTVSVTCIANDGCEEKDVQVTANLVANGDPMASSGDNVTATVECDGVEVVSVFDNLPGTIPNTLDGVKPESGDYACIMVFDVQTVPYSGAASCSDSPALPALPARNEPSLCTGSVRIIADVLIAGGATCEFSNGAAPLACPTFKAALNTWSQVCIVDGGCEAKSVTRTAHKITDILEATPVLLKSRVTVSAPCGAPGGLTIDNTGNGMSVTQTSMKVAGGAYVCRINYVVNSPLTGAGTTLIFEGAAACND